MFLRKIALASALVLASFATACSANESASDDSPAEQEGNLTTSQAHEGGVFETFIGADGKNYFRLVAANGRFLLRSEAYEASSGPDAAIQSLLDAVAPGAQAGRFEKLPAADGGFYINVTGKAPSNEIIATSEVYADESNAERALTTIKAYLKGISKASHVEAKKSGKRFDLIALEEHEAPNRFKFMLRADNGEAILFSEGYTTKDAALNGIKAVKDYGRLAENFEVKPLARGAVFGLLAHKHSSASENPNEPSNHKAVGFSELYSDKSGASRGAETVQKVLSSAGEAEVNDLTK